MPQAPNPNPYEVNCAFAFAPFEEDDGKVTILYITDDPDVGIGWRMRVIESSRWLGRTSVRETPVTVGQVQRMITLRYESAILEITHRVANEVKNEWPGAVARLVDQVANRAEHLDD